MIRPPKILVFDSGLGGLTVLRALMRRRPEADFVYAADDLGFPYGPKAEAQVVSLVMRAMEKLVGDFSPDCVVVACNTASTLVLPHLRTRWPDIPFVGTVPAIKPAAKQSKSRMISVLATPGTVSRDYTRDLIAKFAGPSDVTLVGSHDLAALAEAFMQGESIADEAVAAEIAPCFVEKKGRRTDEVVLACTHYPLLVDYFTRLAPWPVDWIDPAPAIARQADHVLAAQFPAAKPQEGGLAQFVLTSGALPAPRLVELLTRMRRDAGTPAAIFQPAD